MVQARSYLYAKYAAAYILSKKGIFKDDTICNRNLIHDTGISTASLMQQN